MKQIIYFFAIFYGIPYSSFAQSVLFVDGNATGVNNGSTWANAFIHLNTALQYAQSGDTIWVAAGEYRATTDGNRDSSFILKNGVAIYGGFNGTETSFFQRDFRQHLTILSGDIGIPNQTTDNSYNVVFGSGLDSTTIIDGFIIEKGVANNTNAAEANLRRKQGGGMFLESIFSADCNPIVRNCIFRNNYASSAAAAFFAGGSTSSDANPLISYCSFLNNTTPVGATVQYGIRQQGSQRTIKIHNCFFGDNSVGTNIAFLLQGGNLTLELDRDTFNSPEGGAPFSLLGTSSGSAYTKINNSFFFRNKRCRINIDISGENECILTQNTFLENAIIEFNINYQESANLLLINNFFDKNRSSLINSSGKLSLYGNQIHSSEISFTSPETNCRDNIFKKNRLNIISNKLGNIRQSLHYQDTLSFSQSNLSFQSCSFVNCMPGEYTNALFQAKDTLLFNSCLFTGAFSENYSLIDTLTLSYPYVRASHCVFEDVNCNRVLQSAPQMFCDGNNIFGAKLLFYDTIGGDFHLLPCSTGINAGDSFAISASDISSDLSQYPRVVGGLPDAGAFETQEVYSLPQISSEIIPASSSTSSDGAIVIELLNDTATYFYVWNTGTIGPIIENITYGVYTVTITSANGCSNEYTFTVGTVETTEPTSSTLSLSPNPAISGDNLLLSHRFFGTIQINDLAGRKITAITCLGENTISLPQLPVGLYTVVLNSKSGILSTIMIYIRQ